MFSQIDLSETTANYPSKNSWTIYEVVCYVIFFLYYFRLIQESQTMMSFKTLFLHQYIPKIILLPLNKMLLYPLLGGIKQNTFSFYQKLENQFIGIYYQYIFIIQGIRTQIVKSNLSMRERRTKISDFSNTFSYTPDMYFLRNVIIF